MEFHQLTSFVTVARTGNVTRAAAKLNTTPPAVSTHIRQLEEELGLILFTRTSKGMQLTSEGERIEKKARDILMASNEMHQFARTLQQDVQGHVSLGINADPGYLKIPELIKDLHLQYPGIQLEIITSSTGKILKQVEAGKMDCGFVFGTHEGSRVETVFLSSVDLEIAIPRAFKQKTALAGLQDIAALPWLFPTTLCPLLDTVKTFLDQKGIELSNKVFANDEITKATFIEQGLAVSVLERSEAEGYAKKRKIFFWQGDQKFETSLSFVYSRQRADDRVIRALTACLKKTRDIK